MHGPMVLDAADSTVRLMLSLNTMRKFSFLYFDRNVNKALLIPLSTPYDTSNAAGGGEHFSVRKRDAQNSETGT